MTTPVQRQAFKLRPYKWQLEALEMSRQMGSVGLLAEMGTGKTGALINILRLHYGRHKRMMRTLILTPLVTVYNWQDEFGIHSYIKKEDIVVLDKRSSKAKINQALKQIEDKVSGELKHNKILIVNYDVLLNKVFIAMMLEWGVEVLVCDESHMVKTPSAKRSKATTKVADQARYKFIMTGTPILNNVRDIFNQFRILDGGETFGKSYSVFTSKYMMDENEAWKGRQGYFPNLVARPEMFGELTDLIYKKCIRVLKKDCLDLPPLIKEKRVIELTPKQRKYYEEMKRDFVTFIDENKKSGNIKGSMIAQVAVTKALRLQQIVTGYLPMDNGESVELDDNPRLAATKDLLEELTPNHKVIVWCSFIKNYEMLGRICTELGLGHVYITGKMSLQQKKEAMDEFRQNDGVRVVIANRKAGGIGINLVEASYSIVYSRNFSLGDELQSEARNHRGGSEIHDKITKIDLVARDTIDEQVLEALSNKQDISSRVIDLIK